MLPRKSSDSCVDKARVAFEVGYDHYRFDLPLAIERFSEDRCRQAVQDGYAAAKIQNVSRKKPDMFEKKLMTLRDRALVKGLPVTIGTGDIKAALKEARGICPITQSPLTFCTLADTDWSVDRIDNNEGYQPGNIVVISCRANEAKGSLDLAEIIKLAFLSHTHHAQGLALEAIEWMRMARFYFKRLQLLRPVRLCKLMADDPVVLEFFIYALLLSPKPGKPSLKRFYRQLEIDVGKQFLERFCKHAWKRAFAVPSLEYAAIANSPKLAHNLRVLREAVLKRPEVFDGLLIECFFN